MNAQTKQHLDKVQEIYARLRGPGPSWYMREESAAMLTLAAVQSETAEQTYYASLAADRTAAEVQRLAGV